MRKKTLGARRHSAWRRRSRSPDAAGSSSGSASTARRDIRVWLVGTDTPDAARDYLKTTFEKENPGSTLTIEEQAWTGLVDKLTTSLSGSDSPDVVEVGNTQAAAFTSAGAFPDLTDKYEDLGGDDLLPGFVEAGTYDGKLLRRPLLLGRPPGLLQEGPDRSGRSDVPTTLDEYVANGEALAAANPGVSGIYFPGQDWYNALPYIWENGGDDRHAGRRHVEGRLLEPRVDRGPRADAGRHDEGSSAPEGRQRDRPAGAVLRGRGRASSRLPAGSRARSSPRPTPRHPAAPTQESEPRRLRPARVPTAGRRTSSPVARTSPSRPRRPTPISPTTRSRSC